MRVCIANNSRQQIGGGWTFMRNLQNALKDRVQFVNSDINAEIMVVTGPTIVDPSIIRDFKKRGGKVLFRVDNVPKKSRNKRCTPYQRMVEFSELADVVVYQSEWARNYCEPLTGEGTVIYNGVDTNLFKPNKALQPEHARYLFAYHGNNELKGFWEAHFYFQMLFRNNKEAEFWFIYDFKRDLPTYISSDYDFWNGEKYRHLPMAKNEKEMAYIMQQCTHLIYPSIADASPNVVLEARASGLKIVGIATPEQSGTYELLNDRLDISLKRMGDEYYGVFQLLTQNV